MKKHILDDVLELNCKVYALVSASPFMELAICLRNELNIAIVRVEDTMWETTDNKHHAPRYIYNDEQTETEYAMIRNRGDLGLMVAEYRNVDAFLIETNYSNHFGLSVGQIIKAKCIQYCFEVDVSSLKKNSQQRLNIS